MDVMVAKLVTFSLSVVSCLAVTTYSREVREMKSLDLRIRQIQQYEADHKSHFQLGPIVKCEKDDETCDPYNRYYIVPQQEKTEYDL